MTRKRPHTSTTDGIPNARVLPRLVEPWIQRADRGYEQSVPVPASPSQHRSPRQNRHAVGLAPGSELGGSALSQLGPDSQRGGAGLVPGPKSGSGQRSPSQEPRVRILAPAGRRQGASVLLPLPPAGRAGGCRADPGGRVGSPAMETAVGRQMLPRPGRHVLRNWVKKRSWVWPPSPVVCSGHSCCDGRRSEGWLSALAQEGRGPATPEGRPVFRWRMGPDVCARQVWPGARELRGDEDRGWRPGRGGASGAVQSCAGTPRGDGALSPELPGARPGCPRGVLAKTWPQETASVCPGRRCVCPPPPRSPLLHVAA